MNPFSIAPPSPGASTYGFGTSPAYMGEGSTGGAQPMAPSMGLLGALQPFLQRMQAQAALAQKMNQPPPAPAAQPGGAPMDANGNGATPASGNNGWLGGPLGIGRGSNAGWLTNMFKSFGGGGDQPGQPLNILPPAPTP